MKTSRWACMAALLLSGPMHGCDFVEHIFGCDGDSRVPLQEQRVSIDEGVWGRISFWEGNFMPGDRCTSGRITPAQRLILFFEPTPDSMVVHPAYNGAFASEIRTSPVDSVWSDGSGFFELALPPGRYSMFVREDSLLYANGWDDQIIYPVNVTAGMRTAVSFDIDYEAAY